METEQKIPRRCPLLNEAGIQVEEAIPCLAMYVITGQAPSATSTYDTPAFVAAPAVFCVVASAAVVLPARAGMKVEPTVALRYE